MTLKLLKKYFNIVCISCKLVSTTDQFYQTMACNFLHVYIQTAYYICLSPGKITKTKNGTFQITTCVKRKVVLLNSDVIFSFMIEKTLSVCTMHALQ